MNRARVLRAVTAAAGGAGLVLALAGPAGAQQGPPGNNGTVKVDGVEFDDHPNNEPHVGCVFQVDLYNYDEGEDLEADIVFQAWPPTGDREVLLEDTLAIGEDPNGGGTDLDASGTYDLTEALAGFEPHPEQGWHVRLTVHADGSQGADTKHKTFWVSGCGDQGTTTTSSSTTSTTDGGSTTTTHGGSTTTTHGGSTTSSVPAGTTPSSGPSDQPGVSPSAPTTTPAAAEGELPETGSNTVPLVVGAAALLALGTGGVLGARYLRAARG